MATMMDMSASAGAEGGASHLDDSHVCPVCREVFTDAFSTLCGHTFCFSCITTHLKHMQTCPCCCQVRERRNGEQRQGNRRREGERIATAMGIRGGAGKDWGSHAGGGVSFEGFVCFQLFSFCHPTKSTSSLFSSFSFFVCVTRRASAGALLPDRPIRESARKRNATVHSALRTSSSSQRSPSMRTHADTRPLSSPSSLLLLHRQNWYFFLSRHFFSRSPTTPVSRKNPSLNSLYRRIRCFRTLRWTNC